MQKNTKHRNWDAITHPACGFAFESYEVDTRELRPLPRRELWLLVNPFRCTSKAVTKAMQTNSICVLGNDTMMECNNLAHRLRLRKLLRGRRPRLQPRGLVSPVLGAPEQGFTGRGLPARCGGGVCFHTHRTANVELI